MFSKPFKGISGIVLATARWVLQTEANALLCLPAALPDDLVPAVEVSHDDLGIITSDDICNLITNSGETTDLGGLIHRMRRFLKPLVVVDAANAPVGLLRVHDCLRAGVA